MLVAERSCAMGVDVAEVVLFVANQIHSFVSDQIHSFIADACEPPQRIPLGSQRGRARRKRRGNTQCQAMDEGAIPQI